MKNFISYLIVALFVPGLCACSSSDNDDDDVLPDIYDPIDDVDDEDETPRVYEVVFTLEGEHWKDIDVDVTAVCVADVSLSEKGILINDKLYDATTTYTTPYTSSSTVSYTFNSDSMKICKIRTEGKMESLSVGITMIAFRATASGSRPFNIKAYSDGNLIKEIENSMDDKDGISYQLLCAFNKCEVYASELKL